MSVKIDMNKFLEYINSMNELVNTLVDSNVIFRDVITSLSTRWKDDIYREVINTFLALQKPTNDFINKLEDLDLELINWYVRLYNEYYGVIVNAPRLSMGRVKDSGELMMREDDTIETSSSAMEEYMDSARVYISTVNNLLDDFEYKHHIFSEYFQTKRYEEISSELKRYIDIIKETMDDISSLVDFIEVRIDIIRSHE